MTDISPIVHACTVYWPGHLPHWIQARKAMESPGVPLSVLAVTSRGVIVSDGEGATEWFVHSPARALVRTRLDRGPVTATDYGLRFAVVDGTALTYCEDLADWRDCSTDRAQVVSTRGHFGVIPIPRD